MYRANSNGKMSCYSQSEMLNNACRTHIHVLTNNEAIKDIDNHDSGYLGMAVQLYV